MPATVTDSTKPNPLRPATSSTESPLAAHSSSTDKLAPVTTAAGLGATAARVSPFCSPWTVLASPCGGTTGVPATSACRGNAVPLARFVVGGEDGGFAGIEGPAGRP